MLLDTISILILFVVISYANVTQDSADNTAQDRQDDCNCSWQPVFRPSPIVHSELPEHHHPYDIYSTRSDLKIVPHIIVPVVNPVAYTLHHDFGNQDQPQHKYSLLDSSVTESVDSNGKPVIKWEHYGDLKQISFKYKDGRLKNNKNRLYNHKPEMKKAVVDSHEDTYKEVSSKEEKIDKSKENHEQENVEDDMPCDENNHDEKYFNSESFFDDNLNLEEDTDMSKDFSGLKDTTQEDDFSNAFKTQTHSNEITSEKPILRIDKPIKPATSYTSISSLFSELKTNNYNDLGNLYKARIKSPYSHTFSYFNGHGHAHLVHHDKPSWFKHLKPKFNDDQYRTNVKPYSVYEHHPEETRSYGYSKYSPLQTNYYPLNKDYLLGDFWKSAKKMEQMKPPALGQTLTWFMKNKKPRTISFSRNDLINNKKPFSYVYIIKSNKDSNPVFINH